MEGLAAEPQELYLGDRPHPGHGQPERRPGDDCFGQRHVNNAVLAEHLLQAVGHAEHATEPANVLAEHHHPLVLLHLQQQGVADRLSHCHHRHARLLSSER